MGLADLDRDLDGDAAFLGELDGIVEKIEQYLPQSHGVAAIGAARARFDERRHVDRFFAGLGCHEGNRAFNSGHQVEVDDLDLELAGLELGNIENVVHDGQQGLARLARDLGQATLFRVEVCIQEQIGHAQYPVHRRADFVAHVRQELGFRARAGFGFILGRQKRSGGALERAHGARQQSDFVPASGIGHVRRQIAPCKLGQGAGHADQRRNDHFYEGREYAQCRCHCGGDRKDDDIDRSRSGGVAIGAGARGLRVVDLYEFFEAASQWS